MIGMISLYYIAGVISRPSRAEDLKFKTFKAAFPT